MGFLILPHPLTNFETQKYYKNEQRFNGVFSRKSLPKSNFIKSNSITKIKDGAYITNLDEYANVGTHWIDTLYCFNNLLEKIDKTVLSEQTKFQLSEIIGNNWN